jgi:hypothetical protein
VRRINDYLKRMASGQTKADFLRDLPDLLLVEIEGTEGGGGAEDVAVTARLTSNAIKSQSLASREAKVFPLGGKDGLTLPVAVGRALHCGIAIDHPSVSKEHARLEREKGGLLVEDLGSTNGTFVNGQRLAASEKKTVRCDDAVRFGRASMFHLLDPAGFYSYLDLLQRFGL